MTLLVSATPSSPYLSIVVPVFNESESLNPFFERITPILNSTGLDYEIVCVNDGSRDTTYAQLCELRAEYPNIKVIDLSRNFGKESRP